MPPRNRPLARKWLLCYALAAAGSYHLAMLWQPLAGWFLLAYLACLWELRRAATARTAFYFGWLAGLVIMVPETWFLVGIFNRGAVGLWLLMTVWLGLMTSLWQAGSCRWRAPVMLWLAPVLMLGVEYFRSEVWPLKFAWHTAGFGLPAELWGAALWVLGVYGLGAVLLGLVVRATTRRRWLVLACLPLVAWPLGWGRAPQQLDGGTLAVAGLQWENAGHQTYLNSLDEAAEKFPDTQLFVCSEYSFIAPPDAEIKGWAKAHRAYLLTGGQDQVPGQKFNEVYNTAFLTNPEGVVIQKQVKAVPIPLMDDGLPAPSQTVWRSPWGVVGICICYDMNYRQVTDELVRQGAQALVIPAMDKEDWGYREHVLSARLGTTRAAEYGIPVFRLASSGISQVIQSGGRITAETSFPGQGEIIAEKLLLGKGGHLPLDRWLGWGAVIVTAGILLWLMAADVRKRWQR